MRIHVDAHPSKGWGAKPLKSGRPEGRGPEGWGPERWWWGRRVGGPKGGGPAFFPFPPPFSLFFSLWGSSRGIFVVFEAGCSNVHVWSSLAVVCNRSTPIDFDTKTTSSVTPHVGHVERAPRPAYDQISAREASPILGNSLRFAVTLKDASCCHPVRNRC